MVAAPTPVEVFCSYAHEDEAWLHKLGKHLSLLKRQGLISLWHDRLISPGTDWAQSIDTHLETASVILLLVSADFFTSDYCYGIEMKRALERQEAGEAQVIPILVRLVDWKNAPFGHLQALPTDAKPIASWPNQDTALADVAAGVRRVIVEELPQLTASAPRAALPKIWNVPYPRNLFFLGRDAELLQVRHNLHAGQATALSQPQAINGLGGIGKTQLALEYAYRYHQDYTAVLWARAESIDALVSSYITLATLLHLPEREAKEQDITVQAVKVWLQTHRGWLLVLDNADELTLLPDFLPTVLSGHLILTTRAAATGRLAQRLEIETLEPEQGALFLLRRAGLIAPDAELLHVSDGEQEQAKRLTQKLGGLPLALDQAGAYLEETGTDLTTYGQIYQQHRATLLRERRGLVPDYPSSVATTWSVSFQRVEERNPAAAELLRLCAFLAPDAIPEEILTAGAPAFGPVFAPVAGNAFLLNQAIEALRAYSLLRRDPKKKVLSIHRLVQAVLQDSLEEAERRTWAKRALVAVDAAFPDAEPETWPQCERLLPQALAGAQNIEQYQMTNEEARHLLSQTADYLYGRARYAEAEPLFRRALRIWEQQLGPEHPVVAYLLNKLGLLYKDQGKDAEAEPLYQRALRIWEQQLGPEHPAQIPVLNNLANLYSRRGKDKETKRLYRRALYIGERHLGPKHSDVAHSLTGLAAFYNKQGKYAQAGPLYQRALRIWEQQLGPEHPLVAHSLNGLGGLYSKQGKDAQAEPLYQRALRIFEQHLGPEHPEVAQPLDNLANLYSKQGKDAQAEPLYQRTLRILEQHLGPEHPEVATLLNELALCYGSQGKYAQAVLLFQRALRILEQHLGPEHPEVAFPIHGLAAFYSEQGKYAEAEPLYQRALRILEQHLGPEHSQVAALLNSLALLYCEQDKCTEAEPLYRRTLCIREQALGSKHPDVAETMHGLARSWERKGNDEKAKAWLVRALAIREQVLGAHHPKTTETRTCLIDLLHTMGQHEQAAQLEAVQSEP